MWWFILGLTAFVVLYIILIRPLLRKQPWAQGFFANPIVMWMEVNLWRRSESILWARFQQFMGILIAVLAYLGQLDVSIIAPIVEPQYQPLVPLALNVSGTIAEVLRRDTSKPLEVVEAPETPAMIQAEAKLEEANKEAKVVAATETAKAGS